MGQVLAMTGMTISRRTAGMAAMVGLMLIPGCGDLAKTGIGPRVAGALFPALAGTPPPASGGLDFSAQAIAADTSQFAIFTINALAVQAPGRIIQNNGADQTWTSQSGFTATYSDGMLVATRGFGDDLMASDTVQSRLALVQGGGTAQRSHDFLDDFDQMTTVRFDCEIVAQGREVIDLGLRQPNLAKYEETCTSPKLVFANIYWLDDTGEILQSRQFVSQTVAYLRFNRL